MNQFRVDPDGKQRQKLVRACAKCFSRDGGPAGTTPSGVL
jgi:hypothetical protein